MAVVSIKNKLRRGNLLVGNEAYIPTDFESIATTTVGSTSVANIEFTSIASTYTHLQIRLINLSSSAGTNLELRFNSDTGNNYDTHWLYGSGSSVIAGAATNLNYVWAAGAGSSTAPAGVVVDILDYGNTNKYKTVRTLGGYDTNGGGYIYFTSGLWGNTNAITSLKITCNANFNQYSQVALYGIKVAS